MRTLAVAALLLVALAAPAGATPRVILDTDMYEDVDDVGAVAMLHGFEDRGDARIVAMMVNAPMRRSPLVVDAINEHYGRGDIPIGVRRPLYEADPAWPYYQAVADEFPSDLRNPPDAVQLYRRELARQPDRSVVVLSVGFMTNLRGLLESPGGRALVRRKVRLLVATGVRIPRGREYNVRPLWQPWSLEHAAAGASVTRRWPTPIVYSGNEVGADVLTGRGLRGRKNPVRRAYELYLGGPGRDRPSWDQTAVWYAIRGARPFFRLSPPGRNVIDPVTGANVWRSGEGGQRYLVRRAPNASIARAVNGLMSSR